MCVPAWRRGECWESGRSGQQPQGCSIWLKETKKSTTAAHNKPAIHTARGQPAARAVAVPAFQRLLQLVLVFCQWSVLVLRSGSSFLCGTAQPQRKLRSLWAGPSPFAVSWPQARWCWHPPGRWHGGDALQGMRPNRAPAPASWLSFRGSCAAEGVRPSCQQPGGRAGAGGAGRGCRTCRAGS